MFWKEKPFDRIARVEQLSRHPWVQEAAAMVAIAQTGVDFDDHAIETMSGRLAWVSHEHGATPEDFVHAIELHNARLD